MLTLSFFCSGHSKNATRWTGVVEAAHLKYAALRLAVSYPEAFRQRGVTVEVEVGDMLQEITPSLYDAFQAKYAGLQSLFYVRSDYFRNVSTYKDNYLLVVSCACKSIL